MSRARGMIPCARKAITGGRARPAAGPTYPHGGSGEGGRPKGWPPLPQTGRRGGKGDQRAGSRREGASQRDVGRRGERKERGQPKKRDTGLKTRDTGRQPEERGNGGGKRGSEKPCLCFSLMRERRAADRQQHGGLQRAERGFEAKAVRERQDGTPRSSSSSSSRNSRNSSSSSSLRERPCSLLRFIALGPCRPGPALAGILRTKRRSASDFRRGLPGSACRSCSPLLPSPLLRARLARCFAGPTAVP